MFFRSNLHELQTSLSSRIPSRGRESHLLYYGLYSKPRAQSAVDGLTMINHHILLFPTRFLLYRIMMSPWSQWGRFIQTYFQGVFLPWNKLQWRRLISLRAIYPLIRHHREMVILLSSIRGKLMSIAFEPPIWNEMLCGEWISNRFVGVLWLHRATTKNSVCPCWVFEKNQPSKSSLKFLRSNALESRSSWAHS